MSNTDLNDSLDDLIGARSDITRTPQATRQAPADFMPDRAFVEGCSKCRGTGQTRWGICFKCKGVGSKTFKRPAAERAAVREARQVRQASKAVAGSLSNWETFKVATPAIAGWIEANPGFNFAVSMKQAVERWGSLTPNQLAACQRGLERNAQRAIDRAASNSSAPEVSTAGVDRLKLAFDKAVLFSQSKGKGRSIKWPKITIGGVVISPAKADSPNAGALYVKEAGEYRGKIMNGRFYARDCDPVTEKRILAFIADPKGAAEAYGIETGTCCICNATLTNKVSIERGIGPICGEKFGW